VEHAGEIVCGIEDGIAWFGQSLVGREELGEGGYAVLQNLFAQLGRAALNGSGERLASPDACDGGVTRKEVFMDAGELVVRLAGASDDEAVNETFGDGFRHGVPEEVLDDHGCRSAWICVGVCAAQDVREGGLAKFAKWCRWCADGVCSPSVDELLKL